MSVSEAPDYSKSLSVFFSKMSNRSKEGIATIHVASSEGLAAIATSRSLVHYSPPNSILASGY